MRFRGTFLMLAPYIARSVPRPRLSQLLAGVRHLLAAVPLRNHDERSSMRLEQVHVGIHAARGGRSEGARGHSLGGLGRTGVVDGVVLQVLRQVFPAVDPLLEFCMGDIASDDDGTCEG